MLRLFIRWFTSIFLYAIALIVVAQLFDSFYIDGFGTALLASVILSILNVIVRPLLIVLTLPITIMTLGLFVLVINTLTLMLAQALMGPEFVIDDFGVAFIASILISIIHVFLSKIVGNRAK